MSKNKFIKTRNGLQIKKQQQRATSVSAIIVDFIYFIQGAQSLSFLFAVVAKEGLSSHFHRIFIVIIFIWDSSCKHRSCSRFALTARVGRIELFDVSE